MEEERELSASHHQDVGLVMAVVPFHISVSN